MRAPSSATLPWKQSESARWVQNRRLAPCFAALRSSVSPPVSRPIAYKTAGFLVRSPQGPPTTTDLRAVINPVQKEGKKRARGTAEMAASVASTKAPSLVVAASMGAVEALKDQAGLCRWDYALRSLYHRAAAPRIQALSTSLAKAAPTASPPAQAVGARPASAEDVRLHKAYHLVCWGPN